MHISDLQGKKIGILGFGIEGRAVGQFLSRHNLEYSVFDSNSGVGAGIKPENFYSGENFLDSARDFDVLFRSPGVKFLDPRIQAAKNSGAIITSQIKFFMENCQAQIIGVTGTKGKGTTAKLIHEILLAAGKTSYIGGNFGIETLSLLDQLKPEDYVVLELSSFQLQDLEISPHIAVVLMVVPEHLDYHVDVQEYVQAKYAITKYQIATDIAIVNHDFPYSMEIGQQGSGKKLYVQTLAENQLEKSDPFAIYKPETYLQIKNGVFAEEEYGNIYFVQEGETQLLINATEVPLRGFHNLQNVSAAAAVAHSLDIKDAVIIDAIKAYKGLEHRLEFVGEGRGIKFYNDSIGTTPESSLAAIRAFHEPVYAIIGGMDKHSDYEVFAAELAKQKNLRGVAIVGEIAPQIEKALHAHHFAGKIYTGAASMSAAFDQLVGIAEKGDVILLAPGTSSFDMFKDYKDRGEQFRTAAHKITF